MKEENRKIVPICYIHKVAMKKIEQEEPIPEYGIYRYVEYKCPVCLTTCVET